MSVSTDAWPAPHCVECGDRTDYETGCFHDENQPRCWECLHHCYQCGNEIREQAAEELAGPNFGAVGF